MPDQTPDHTELKSISMSCHIRPRSFQMTVWHSHFFARQAFTGARCPPQWRAKSAEARETPGRSSPANARNHPRIPAAPAGRRRRCSSATVTTPTTVTACHPRTLPRSGRPEADARGRRGDPPQQPACRRPTQGCRQRVLPRGACGPVATGGQQSRRAYAGQPALSPSGWRPATPPNSCPGRATRGDPAGSTQGS